MLKLKQLEIFFIYLLRLLLFGISASGIKGFLEWLTTIQIFQISPLLQDELLMERVYQNENQVFQIFIQI